MQKLFIKNRKGQKMAMIVEEARPQKGLAFVMHGLGGFKEQSHLQVIAEAFLAHGYTVVRFDTTNSVGESEGDLLHATATTYIEDLEDVIAWAKQQLWYVAPFVLIGHSLGALSVAWYAEHHPLEVKAVAPIGTVVTGKLNMERYAPEFLAQWKTRGYILKESNSKPGLVSKLGWGFIEDGLRYDLLQKVETLTMPVLLVVGDNDEATPLTHQQLLYDALPGPKELHIIQGAPHTFRAQEHLDELKKIFDVWLAQR